MNGLGCSFSSWDEEQVISRRRMTNVDNIILYVDLMAEDLMIFVCLGLITKITEYGKIQFRAQM